MSYKVYSLWPCRDMRHEYRKKGVNSGMVADFGGGGERRFRGSGSGGEQGTGGERKLGVFGRLGLVGIMVARPLELRLRVGGKKHH